MIVSLLCLKIAYHIERKYVVMLRIVIILNLFKQPKSLKTRFHYEREKDYSLFVLLIVLLCLALASILSAERLIKETKNALFHARSGNGP